MSELTTQEKIEAWEKVLTGEQLLELSAEQVEHVLDEVYLRYTFQTLLASGMASRRAFIQEKIDELKGEQQLSPEQSKEER